MIPVVGWLAGVALLWSSTAWTTKEKLLGTFVLPGGYAALVWLMWFGYSTGEDSGCVESVFKEPGAPAECGGSSPDDGSSLLSGALVGGGVTVMLIAPLAMAIFLGLRLRKRTRAAERAMRRHSAAQVG